METLLTLFLFGAIAALMLLDVVAPARAFPKVRFWRLRGVLGFVMFVAVSTLAPTFWDEALGRYRLIDATALGPWLGGIQPANSPEPGGNYQWSDGSAFSYTNWSGGEPNNSATTENRIHLYGGGGNLSPHPILLWLDGLEQP